MSGQQGMQGQAFGPVVEVDLCWSAHTLPLSLSCEEHQLCASRDMGAGQPRTLSSADQLQPRQPRVAPSTPVLALDAYLHSILSPWWQAFAETVVVCIKGRGSIESKSSQHLLRT